jgi:hypothetical protein
MKFKKLLSFMAIALLIFAVACSDDKKGESEESSKSDGATYADMECEMRGLQNDLMAAYESEDEAKIEELSTKIEKAQNAMDEFDKKMEKKYKGNEEGMQKAMEDYTKAIGDCKHEASYGDDPEGYGDSEELEYTGGEWSEIETTAFMEECEKGLLNQPGIDGKKYCACMLEKLQYVYTNAIEAQNMDMNKMQEWALECIQ